MRPKGPTYRCTAWSSLPPSQITHVRCRHVAYSLTNSLQHLLEGVSAAVAQRVAEVATHLRDTVGVTTYWGVARLTIVQLMSAGLTEGAARDVVDSIALYEPPQPVNPIPNVPPQVYPATPAQRPRRTPLEEARAKQLARAVATIDT